MDWKSLILDVPDFPKAGIIFKDITPLLSNPEAFAEVVRLMAAPAKALGVTKVAGIESRGFLFGVAVARELGVGFIPVRKPKKLPRKTIREEYALEYGTDAVEIHADATSAQDKVYVVDDVLATGGTLAAGIKLFQRTGATVVGSTVLIELGFLKGRSRLNVPCSALMVL